MADMNVSLLISFLTKGAEKVRQDVAGIRKGAKDLREGFSGAIRQGFSTTNIDTALANAEQRLSRARGRLTDALGMAVALAAPIRAAAQFEDAFADLEKVLDVPVRKLGEIRKGLLGMSRNIAMSATGLTTIMAAAAQGGIPTEQLERFTAFTARAAVAFDMAAEQIGTRFAKLRNVYRLGQEGLELFADAANHLSNNMAATAAEITDFANRAAGAQRTLKLTAVQMNAVGAAMVAAGIAPETAARGVSALANRLAQGGAKARGALKMAGLTYKGFMASLDADAPAALQDLFERLSKSPDGMKALIDLVGQDFSDDFSKLLNNPDLLAQAFRLVAEEAEYAGSATDEYNKRAQTTLNRFALFKNQIASLAIMLGDVLLPTINELMETTSGLVARFAAFAEANPELTAQLVEGAAALLAFGVASRVVSYAYALMAGPLIRLASLFWRFAASGRNISLVARALRGLRAASGGLGRAAASVGLFLASFGPRRIKSALAGLAMLSTVMKGGVIAAAFAGLKTAATAALSAIAAAGWPVTVVLAAIAAAAFSVWKYWDRLKAAVGGFFDGLASAFAPEIEAVKQAWSSFVDSVAARAGEIAASLGINVDAVRAAFARMFDLSGVIASLKEAKQAVANFFASFFTAEQLSETEAGEISAAGRRIGERIGNAIRDTLRAFTGFGTAIVEAIISGLEGAWGTLTAWFEANVAALKGLLDFGFTFGGGQGSHNQIRGELLPPGAGATSRPNSPFPAENDNSIPPLESYARERGLVDAPKVEQKIKAEVIDKRLPQVTVNVSQSITGVTDPVAAANAANRGITDAVRRAKTGAMHGGTE
ncbi:phage tail tape measure protein [Stappia sp.]|uniref:phage tail tape measure protein n=1 Tax=Stappia sp. TaxID=1870903 RepID=UPI003D0C65B2